MKKYVGCLFLALSVLVVSGCEKSGETYLLPSINEDVEHLILNEEKEQLIKQSLPNEQVLRVFYMDMTPEHRGPEIVSESLSSDGENIIFRVFTEKKKELTTLFEHSLPYNELLPWSIESVIPYDHGKTNLLVITKHTQPHYSLDYFVLGKLVDDDSLEATFGTIGSGLGEEETIFTGDYEIGRNIMTVSSENETIYNLNFDVNEVRMHDLR